MRIGFYAAMKLDEKGVLKHENTLQAPKEDRLKLLKEVRTNLSPIFGLFEDKKGVVQSVLKKSLKRSPVMDFQAAGVRHRLYLEKNSGVIQKISGVMKSKPMFIADGHHRFEVACQFKNWMRLQKNGKGHEWEYVLTYFSDCSHNPFEIFPTHRLVRLAKGADFRKILGRIGALEKAKDLKTVLSTLSQCRSKIKDKRYRFGLYSKSDGFWFLTLPGGATDKIGSSSVEVLDVSVLHKTILNNLLNNQQTAEIDFTRDANDACRKVKSGLFDLAVFLRPTSLEEMLSISKKGLKMPQKSTYFYPKLLTGLVFHGFENSNQ